MINTDSWSRHHDVSNDVTYS